MIRGPTISAEDRAEDTDTGTTGPTDHRATREPDTAEQLSESV